MHDARGLDGDNIAAGAMVPTRDEMRFEFVLMMIFLSQSFGGNSGITVASAAPEGEPRLRDFGSR